MIVIRAMKIEDLGQVCALVQSTAGLGFKDWETTDVLGRFVTRRPLFFEFDIVDAVVEAIARAGGSATTSPARRRNLHVCWKDSRRWLHVLPERCLCRPENNIVIDCID